MIKRQRSNIKYALIGALAGIICVSISLKYVKNHVFKQTIWSIGIYAGESPYSFNNPANIKNPIITAKDITDIHAIYVADPFIIKEDSTWYLFFEAANKKTRHGEIGVALSNDSINWKYKQIVLAEPFHLSFPYVFKFKNDYYMVPESTEGNSIRLYRADNFPFKWTYVCDLLTGNDFVDTSILHYHGKWWLFTTTSLKNNILRLYYADDLKGPWKEHIKSPIVRGNAQIGRSGGRMIVYKDHIIRYAQDCSTTYGRQLWAFKITELTTTTYKEEKISETPILKASGSGWNKEGMHQIDPHQLEENKWIASVDGKSTNYVFGLANTFP
jgi:hypothetical protein